MPADPDDGSGPLDVDAAFAEIVARWHDPQPSAGPVRPVHPLAPAPTDDGGAPDARPERRPGGADEPRSDPDGADPGDASARRPTPPQADPTGTDAPAAAQRPEVGRPDQPRPDQLRPDQLRPDSACTIRPARPLPPAPREDALPGRHVRPEGPPAHATHREDREPRTDRDEFDWLDEGFTPAEPAPLPRDVLGWAAWAAVIGAPLVLLVLALTWHSVPSLLTAAIAAVFVGGFATLVVRLPSSRDDDDDGAVV
ncbi:hypothetical protein ACFFKU_11445 [Kineococcus gynurae]|uniref:Uncharacterized protein n=1 Tax=Kineococcus gynurae TaxID=452979 RepID=A0ABV5LUC3_9ACTN